MNTKTFFCCFIFIPLPSTVCVADWPQWRGPTGQGHSDATGLPTKWDAEKNVGWKTSIPGRGWSSPVIEGEQVWLTTAHEKIASEENAKERLKSNTGGQPLTVLETVRLHAICLDTKSGRILHDI